MREGDLVVVLGKMDQRVREHKPDGLIVGTLWIQEPDQVVVILPDFLLWKGHPREIASYAEQQIPTPSDQKSEDDDSQSHE
jgi:hypothetical protein